MLNVLMQNGFDLDDLIKLGVFVVVAVASALGSLLKKKSSQDEVEVEVLEEEDEGWIEVEPGAGRPPAPRRSAAPVARTPAQRISTEAQPAIPPAPAVRAPHPTGTRPRPVPAQQRRVRRSGDRSASAGGHAAPPAPPAPVRGRSSAQSSSAGVPAPPPPKRRASTPARTVSAEEPSREARHAQPHPGHLEAVMQSRRISRVEGEHLRPHIESTAPEEHAADSGHAAGRAGAGEIRLRLSGGDLRHAVVLAEILAPPLALRGD